MLLSLFVSFLIFFVCVLLDAVVIVVDVIMFLPTYYFFTGYVQVVGEGTSPLCHSCTPYDEKKKL